MTTIHLALGVLLAASVALTLIAAAVGLMGRYEARLVDRVLLVDFGVVAAVTAAGALVLLSGERPADPLHFLYAAVAWLALPIARYLARAGSPRRRAVIMTVGCIAMAGVVARLFMTGS